MSEVKLVKKWMAADGSEHETRQAAESNALRMQALDIIRATDNADTAVNQLIAAGLLSFKVKRERKPRTPKVAAVVAEKPAKAAKAAA